MIEEPFIERLFDNDGDVVICRFSRPTLEPGGEFKCRWTIDWGDQETQHHTCGIDGIQALLLAMRTVHTELVYSEAYSAGRLTYLDQRDLDLPPAYDFDDGGAA